MYISLVKESCSLDLTYNTDQFQKMPDFVAKCAKSKKEKSTKNIHLQDFKLGSKSFQSWHSDMALQLKRCM